tara:strand:+ start:2213 stop:3874 length:1662 start_codon:yes stop_codon:yes gene_type:complete
MDFLDGFLIRKQKKGESILQLFEEKLNSDEFAPATDFSTKEIMDIVNKAKENSNIAQYDNNNKPLKLPIFDKIYAKSMTTDKFSATTDTIEIIGSEDTATINGLIVGALREIQRVFLQIEPKDKSKELFFHLITQFDTSSKKPRNAPGKIKGETQNVIMDVLRELRAGQDISDSLQNKMHDEGLISLRFLVQLQDIKDKTSVDDRGIYTYTISLNADVKRMFEQNEDLLDKLISLVEELSGYSSPKRSDLLSEIKRLQSGKKEDISAASVLSSNYKYARSSLKQMSRIRRKLVRKVNKWDTVKDKFYAATDGLTEGGEDLLEEVWGNKALQDRFLEQWKQLSETGNIDVEELEQKQTKKEVEKLLKYKLQVEELKRAGEKIESLANKKNPEDGFVFLDSELKEKIETLQEEYDTIANNIDNFETFRNEILNEIKEDLNKMLDNQILKAESPMLDKANPKKKKKIKKVLQTAQPSEYMGQDFTKLGGLLSELQDLDGNKSDKKTMKKLDSIEERNLDLVARASELRKDYELLYRQLRGMVYPKSQGDLGEEKDE